MKSIYEYLCISEKFLLNKNIPLDFFYKKSRTTKRAKEALIKYICDVTVKYELTPNNTKLSIYQTPTADFEEIIILELKLYKKIDKMVLKDLVSIISQTITYPIIVVVNVDDIEYQLFMFEFHKPITSDYNSVVEKRYYTYWINLMRIRECDAEFFEIFKNIFDTRKYKNFFEMYNALRKCLLLHRRLVEKVIAEKDWVSFCGYEYYDNYGRKIDNQRGDNWFSDYFQKVYGSENKNSNYELYEKYMQGDDTDYEYNLGMAYHDNQGNVNNDE